MRELKKRAVKEKPKVSPEEYRKFNEGLQILNLRLKNSQCALNVDAIDFRQKVNLKVDQKPTYRNVGKDRCIVEHHYDLSASYEGKTEQLLTIGCTFEAEYQVKELVTDDIFAIFRDVSLPVMTWPYFREFVQSAVVRMGLPPLVLAAIKRG